MPGRDKISDTIRPVIEALGFELFEVVASGSVTRVFIDKDGGVTIGDCVKVARHLRDILEVEAGMTSALEVSSPGVNRRLRHRGDFEKYEGRLAKFKVKQPDGADSEFVRGRIGRVLEEELEILLEGDVIKLVPMNKIEKANLEY